MTTRWLLPGLIDPAPRDPADSVVLARLWQWTAGVRCPHWSLALLSVAAVAAVLLVPGPFWENDLSRLTPVPVAALLRDMRLRQELGAPDVRYVLALHAVSAEQALQAAEALRPRLDGAVAQVLLPVTTWRRVICLASRRSVGVNRRYPRRSKCAV